MFLSTSSPKFHVEDEPLLSFIRSRLLTRFGMLLLVLGTFASASFLFSAPQDSTTTKKKLHKNTRKSTATKTSAAAKTAVKHTAPVPAAVAAARRPVSKSTWKVPTYANAVEGDNVDGEDLMVRRAAVDALGPFNGAVVVTDANTGRILTMVNQKLALQSGCSTVKVPVALAALSENVVDRETPFHLTRRKTIALTEALAHSNNQYFANLGEKLGFERVSYYARMFGLGEKAGLDIQGEQAGILPVTEPKSGIGMMTSFGDGISLTPLEYAALIGAVANGGTLYYLQYPKTDQEALTLVPRIKRRLDIDNLVTEIKPGMMGAVEYGTARRAGNEDPNLPIYGKTGTCTDYRAVAHMGWFGSFVDAGKNKFVVVVMLTGGKSINGPVASGVAGNVYRALSATNLYNREPNPASPTALISSTGTGSN
jgi:membrane peptidoglycan carboxypeptidase